MSLRKSLNRLSLVSWASLPRLLQVKLQRSLFAARARHQGGAVFALDKRTRLQVKLQRPTLLHSDVLTNDFAEKFKTLFPQDYETLLERADQAIQLNFDVLGSGPVNARDFADRLDLKWISRSGADVMSGRVEGLIPWHFDLKQGVGWDPATFFNQIRYGHLAKVDVKVPWELSRGGHFVTLGQAYLLTKDESYADAFVDQVQDWILQNPPCYGVNWSSAMEVGLRAMNWCLALELFHHSGAVTEEFRSLVNGSLFEHGRYLWSNLEWNAEVSTNHYLANLLALYRLGLLLNQPRWSTWARKEWKRELLSQTYTDGFDHEASTAYHGFVSEMALILGILAVRSNPSPAQPADESSRFEQKFGTEFVRRFYLMFETLQRLSSPRGKIPLMGDNDSGRVQELFPRVDGDISPLLAGGAIFLNALELLPAESRTPSDVIWFFGLESASLLDSPIEEKNRPIHRPASYPSGLLALTGVRDHVVFSAQPNGTKGLGNHTHNDKLSWTLSVDEDEFFIDPGTALYTADPGLRNEFRSTSVHNTVMVDGLEQNDFVGGDLFALQNQAQVTVEKFEPIGFIRAVHTGYRRLSDPVLHRRTLQRHAAILMWDLEDELEGRGEHQVQWNFTLGPQIKVLSSNSAEIFLRGQSGELKMTLSPANLSVSIQDSSCAPAYGVIQPTKAIKLFYQGRLPFKLRMVFEWKGFIE